MGNNSRGVLTQCYSTAAVSGSGGGVGGLVGRNDYGVVTQCFWDTQTSGRAGSEGGRGKTTAEMQMSSTFLSAGWVFVGETANGQDRLYVAIEDSAWHIAVLAHPDPNAVLATQWQKWHIPLADVRTVGVDVMAHQG